MCKKLTQPLILGLGDAETGLFEWDRLVKSTWWLHLSDKEGKLNEDADDDDDVEDVGNDGEEVVAGEQPVVEPAVGVGVFAAAASQHLLAPPCRLLCLHHKLYSVGLSQCARAHLSRTLMSVT